MSRNGSARIPFARRLHETWVPLYAYNNEPLPYLTPPLHNKDLLTPLLNGWLT